MPRSCGGGKTATDENAPKKNEKEMEQRWEFMKENKKVRKPENTPQKATKKTRKNDNAQEEKKENTLSTQKATKKKKLPFFLDRFLVESVFSFFFLL